MKILQICSARSIGGGEKHLVDLSNSLANRGHQIFLSLSPESPIKKELSTIPNENIMYSRMRNAVDFFSAFELANFVRETKPEIIHAHIARDYPLAAMAAQLTKTPFVLTRHVLFPLKKIHKIILKNAGGIIAPSNAVADALKKQNLFPAEKIEVIYNGIEIDYYSTVKKEPHENFTVGTIGHLAPIKGHDIFIRAAEIVLKTRPEIKFVIVGEDKSSDGKNRREIENLIAELNLQKNIELVGWQKDIRPYLQNFDLFVSAARQEPFGLVMIEAMVSGIPVIASNSEGAAEIIENDKSGVLFPLEDVKSLARTILDLADRPNHRNTLSLNGQKRVRENFSLETMTKKTEEFYLNVLKSYSS